MRSLKSWLRLGAAAVVGTVLMASPALAQKVQIEYWQYFFDGRVKAIDQLIKQFEAQNPDIKVVHTHFPYEQYRTKVAAAIPAGEGPDVVQLFYGWLDEYRKAGLLQPLSK
jgi:multiple sugar transport system substrate-binding protein